MNEKLIAQIRALANINPSTLGIAERIAARARELAPVRTGYLRDHIYGEDGQAVSEAPYSAYVEFGTRFMEAQPFMRPAVDEQERELLEEAARAAEDAIQEAIE